MLGAVAHIPDQSKPAKRREETLLEWTHRCRAGYRQSLRDEEDRRFGQPHHGHDDAPTKAKRPRQSDPYHVTGLKGDSRLEICLAAAVPLWIEKMKAMPWEERMEMIKGAGDALAFKGDILLFGGGKRGEQGDIFNQLAKAIAVMSFLPGGINTFGGHWETKES